VWAWLPSGTPRTSGAPGSLFGPAMAAGTPWRPSVARSAPAPYRDSTMPTRWLGAWSNGANGSEWSWSIRLHGGGKTSVSSLGVWDKRNLPYDALQRGVLSPLSKTYPRKPPPRGPTPAAVQCPVLGDPQRLESSQARMECWLPASSAPRTTARRREQEGAQCVSITPQCVWRLRPSSGMASLMALATP